MTNFNPDCRSQIKVFTIFLEEIRCQKTIEYKVNLSTKLLFLQKDENALTTLLHSADEMGIETTLWLMHACHTQPFSSPVDYEQSITA